jgi:hypothetical protein
MMQLPVCCKSSLKPESHYVTVPAEHYLNLKHFQKRQNAIPSSRGMVYLHAGRKDVHNQKSSPVLNLFFLEGNSQVPVGDLRC